MSVDVMPGPEGIPTFYKDVRFRSRLEARWAAFFDRVRWPWAYEPLDLPGWIPDFALLQDYELLARTPEQTTISSPIVVEVKPALSWPALTPHRSRIDRAGWAGGHVVLVGAEVPISVPTLGIGQLRYRMAWGPGQVAWCGQFCAGRLTLLSHQKTCLFCCADLTGFTDRTRATSLAHDAWVAAGNDTQWRPR